MASTSGAHADASQLPALEAEMAGYKKELAKVMGRIERLESQQQLTEDDRERLKLLQQKEQSWLDLVNKLQEEKILLLRSSGGAAAGGIVAVGAGAVAAGGPKMYHNILFIFVGKDGEEEPRAFPKTSRLNLQKVLDRRGCDLVKDPFSQVWISFDGLDLQDDMVIYARSGTSTLDMRVATVEGFQGNLIKASEEEALEAMVQDMRTRHSGSAKILDVREITSSSGAKREVDGVVDAGRCAAILEAKQVLDDQAVRQLLSAMKFIKEHELTSEAAALKGKELVGYVAGRTITANPQKANALQQLCKENNIVMLVTSGRALSAGNSRSPKQQIKCALLCRPRLGGVSHPVRTLRTML